MIEIIPAIDMIDGKCVRLSQGDYSRRKVYADHPVEVAKAFEANGISRLHLVDLDGAAARHVVNYRVLEEIATHTSLQIDYGGGIRSGDDLRIAFECGACMVTVGSVAVDEPDLFCRWLATYGSGKLILGADVKDGRIAVDGWRNESATELLPFLREYVGKGVERVLCTDIGRDGMLTGAAVELYEEILTSIPSLHLIASGGVSSVDDIVRLQHSGVPSVVVGKALYEGRITWEELKRFL